MPVKTVIFDLDGTLTDSEPGVIGAYRHALGQMGLQADAAQIRRWIGPPLAEGLAAFGVPEAQVPDAIISWRTYYSATGQYENRLYEGVPEMLASLREGGLVMAVATAKLAQFAATILAHFAIADFFGVVEGASSDGAQVRKGDIVGQALEHLGRPGPADVALVGDREHDMKAALEHGLIPVGVTWGYGTESELRHAGASTVLHSPEAVTAHFLTQLKRNEERGTRNEERGAGTED